LDILQGFETEFETLEIEKINRIMPEELNNLRTSFRAAGNPPECVTVLRTVPDLLLWYGSLMYSPVYGLTGFGFSFPFQYSGPERSDELEM
jgi:hypothetical protein